MTFLYSTHQKLIYCNVVMWIHELQKRTEVTSKVVGWRLDVTGSVRGVDGMEESSWAPANDDTTGADFVSSDTVPHGRTNGAGLDSRDQVADETAAVTALAADKHILTASANVCWSYSVQHQCRFLRHSVAVTSTLCLKKWHWCCRL